MVSVSDTLSNGGATTDVSQQTVAVTGLTGASVLADPVLPADLSIEKDADLLRATVGEQFTYEITVTNNGPGTARTVTVTDQIPAQLSNPEYSTDGNTWQPWTGTYTRGELLNGSSFFVLIRATVNSSASVSIVNTATVSSATTDPNPDNNSATDDTSVASVADIAVNKSADKTSVQPGDVITYTIVTSNNGPGEASRVQIEDRISLYLSGAEFSTDNGASWQPWIGELNLGSIPNGSAVTTLIRATVIPSAQGIITNSVTVNSVTPDPVSSNNNSRVQSSVTTAQPEPAADLSVTNKADKTAVAAGDTLTYTVTASNKGEAAANDVVLTDTIQPPLTKPEYSSDNGANWQPWPGSIQLDNLANGTEVTTLIRATVEESAQESITNTASVSCSTTDPVLSNNISEVQTTVTQPENPPGTKAGTDLSPALIYSPKIVAPYDCVSLSLIVANTGTKDASNVMLAGINPCDIHRITYSRNRINWNEWKGSLQLGTIPAGTIETLYFRGRVSRSASVCIKTEAEFLFTSPDLTPFERCVYFYIPVRC
ncbi:MAG: DUF11 domain-containing protein [Clostridiales bacterium]|jgi:uncharacterized repeat protein (TIGR01451 family)|nr:DUF11 domain-containing protein [Clostridiales bacterium]